MATKPRPHTPPVKPLEDIPLPGLIDVITVQCNITLHRQPAFLKWVAIVRDPVGQTELQRLHGASYDPSAAYTTALADVTKALGQAYYMGGRDATSRPTD